MVGTNVEVYFNLHKKVFSIRDKKTKKVIAHVNNITLANVSFKVSKAGRLRVLKERRKNVHAVVAGTIIAYEPLDNAAVRVTYNPYLYDSFVLRVNKEPVFRATACVMSVTNNIPSITARL
jgi:hypothetical protein